jgi:hypothetical protein
MQQAAQQAIDIQDACNLSGVVYSFARVMDTLCANTTATRDRNSHPIVTMFLLKLCELNGCGSTLHETYEAAEKACHELAQSTGDGHHHYEVVVSNIGHVYNGMDQGIAETKYDSYVKLSAAGYGITGYEHVTMLRDGDVAKDYDGGEQRLIDIESRME